MLDGLVVWCVFVAILPLSLAGDAFTTETVTAVISSALQKITHPVEMKYEVDDDGNLDVEFSDNMAKELNDYLGILPDICGPNKRSDSIEQTPASLVQRQNTVPMLDPSKPLAVPPCFKDPHGPLKKAIAALSSDLQPLIPPVTDPKVSIPLRLAPKDDDFQNELYELALNDTENQFFPSPHVMLAVDIVWEMAEMALSKVRIAVKSKIAKKQWVAVPGGASPKCPGIKKGTFKPACQDDDCDGDLNEICRDGPNKGCPCLPLFELITDNGHFELPLVGKDNPKCNKITTKQGWTIPDAAKDGINQFCNDAKNREGTTCDTDPVIKKFFEGTEKEFSLKLDFIGKKCQQKITFSQQECVANFLETVNGCHGNDLSNPGDLKYGGQYTSVGGSKFDFSPTNVNPVQECTYEDHTFRYMDSQKLTDVIKDFCTKVESESGTSSSGAIKHNGNTGTMDEVILTANVVPKTKMSKVACFNAVQRLNTGCDNTPDNVMGYKSGGTIALGNVDRAWFTVLPWIVKGPRSSTKPETGGHGGGKLLDCKEVLGPETAPKVNADKLQKCFKDFKEVVKNNPDSKKPNMGCDDDKFIFYIRAWQWWNREACYNWCSNQISAKINAGASQEVCQAQKGMPMCQIAYGQATGSGNFEITKDFNKPVPNAVEKC